MLDVMAECSGWIWIGFRATGQCGCFEMHPQALFGAIFHLLELVGVRSCLAFLLPSSSTAVMPSHQTVSFRPYAKDKVISILKGANESLSANDGR